MIHSITKENRLMKETVNFCDFCDRFRDFDRRENFSYEGKRILFDYLEEYEEDCDTEIELDIIALCVEYSEDPLKEVLENYELASFDELQENTWAVMVTDKDVIYQIY